MRKDFTEKEHTYIYTSPLGRAKDTASLTLKKLGMTAKEYPWLREFEAPTIDEDTRVYKVCWDLLPTRWTSEKAYFCETYDNMEERHD